MFFIRSYIPFAVASRKEKTDLDRTMNTLVVVIGLAVMVALATARGYDSYNRRSWDLHGSGLLNNGWNSRHLTRGLNGGHLTRGLTGGHLTGELRRYRRAATGFGPYDSYRGNRRSHFDSDFGRFDRLGSNVGWRSNSGLRSRSGMISNSEWRQIGY